MQIKKETTMKNLNLIYAITILLAILITGCNKNENGSQEEKMIPVKYYLSDQDKSLLDYFFDHKTITFSDQNDNDLVFTTDSLYNIIEKEESNLRNGEELIMRYSCTTDYFPNYSFVITLLALDTSSVRLEIMYGTGTYWTDQGNDYVLSKFIIDPKSKTSTDTTYPNNHILKFDYFDSITLRSEQYYKVYHIKNQTINTDIEQTSDCYYTNELGVIAFENLDDKFWIRKTE